MNTIKRIFLIISFMQSYNITHSYIINIETPNGCPDFPSHFIYPAGSIEVRFYFQITSPSEEEHAYCSIYVEQNGAEYLLYESVEASDEWISIFVFPTNFPNLCFNEIARLKIKLTSYPAPNFHSTKYAYIIIHKPWYQCRFGALRNGVSVLNLNNVSGTFYRTSSCNEISSSTYFVKQYKINFTLYGDFTDSLPVVDTNLSWGYSGALPNFQRTWAAKIFQSEIEARFVSFVYKLTNILGQELDWVPCRPEDATVVYYYVKKPVIQNLVQWLNPITPINPTAFIVCNLQQGNGDLTYEWRDTNEAPGFEFQQVGNHARVTKNFTENINQDRKALQYTVLCRAGNQFGTTPWKSIVVNVSNTIPECPVIRFSEQDYSFDENSILVSSPGKQGKNINDYYHIMNPFLIIKDRIEFTLHETGNFNTSLDKLRLIAASAENGEEIAVTQDGEIINYINDERKATVIHNNKDNVSEKLYYNDDDEVKLKENDNLKVTFAPDGSGYVVLLLRTPLFKDNIAGTISTVRGKSYPFYSRDNSNRVCIKLIENNHGEFYINIKQDIFLNQIAVVKNLNTSVSASLKLKSALVNSTDVSKLLLESDDNYVNIDKDNDLNIAFENQIYHRRTTAYILESTGSYSKEKGTLIADQTFQTKTENSNKLYDNSPNPFNPVTTVTYQLLNDSFVKIRLYDMIGREVRTLVNEFRRAGVHKLVIDGTDLPTGIYFYKIETENFSDTKRMILIK